MKNVSFLFFLPLWVFLSSSSANAADFHQANVLLARTIQLLEWGEKAAPKTTS